MDLVILGNGFDLGHNLHTSYKDFYKYLVDNKSPFFEDIQRFYDMQNEDKWSDFENALLKEFSVDKYNLYINIVKEAEIQGGNLKQQLNYAFQGWIFSLDGQISATRSRTFFYNLFKNQPQILTFNFTRTLEKVYKIPEKRITHIHYDVNYSKAGRLFNIPQELIIGHGPCDYSLLYKDETVINYLKSTEKPVDDVLKTKFFKELSSKMINNIYVIGFSYNNIDLPYFEIINQKCPNAKWHCYGHTKNDLDNYHKYYSFLNTNILTDSVCYQ